jgi:anaerobic selenocysteine-containing dehydrogenase
MAREIRRTTCSRDCPDACGILAQVESGSVVSLAGDPAHPVTQGFLCFRTSRYPALAAGPMRLREPLLRKDGQLVPVGWDEALATAASWLRTIRAESGPAAIFHYRSGGSLGILKQLADLFFDQFGPCTQKVGDICSGAGEAAQIADFGTSDSNSLFDLENSRGILLWGKNPTVSNTHLVPVLKRARARGAQIVLIDPVSHRGRSLAQEFVQPAPGGDFELAMAVARMLLDRDQVVRDAAQFCDGLPEFVAMAKARSAAQWAAAADVTLEQVELLAQRLHEGPTAILVGWGMQRRRHGGAIVRALDALCALSGNLFRSGGGCSFYFKRRKAFTPFGPAVTPPRTLREPVMGQDLLAADPKVRLMWVTAGNPVVMLPDSTTVSAALASIERLVVSDVFLTETAQRAHLVLPVPSLLEDDDLLGAYGHHFLSESRPVQDPPPGVMQEVELFQQLAQRLGMADYPMDSIDDLKRRALAAVAPLGASLASLRAAGGTLPSPVSPPVLFGDGKVQTPSGKVQLLVAPPTEGVADLPLPLEQPGGSAPLWLFSNSTEKSQASIWSGEGLGDRVHVTVHPDAVPGAADRSLVRVVSVRGALMAELRHDKQQRRDVAVMPKGGSFDRGQAANALIPARATDLGLGAAYLDCLVRIVPVEQGAP